MCTSCRIRYDCTKWFSGTKHVYTNGGNLQQIDFNDLNLTSMFVLYQEFTGNKEQFMPVCYLLKNPIVATYIRIIPLAWYGHIALRAGFYGCKSGKQFQLSVPILKIFNKYYTF